MKTLSLFLLLIGSLIEVAIAQSIHLQNIKNPNQNFFNVGDTVMFIGIPDQKIFLLRFNHEFLPALPPMMGSTSKPNDMTLDTFFIYKTAEPFVFKKIGLYFAQTDTTTNEGVGIKVVVEDFPKYRKLENVIDALNYLATKQGVQTIKQDTSWKLGLDKFWLNYGKNIEQSNILLKTYYQRVTYSNLHFTSHKEGWKTDKGMVYIMFGKPKSIRLLKDREVWEYDFRNQDLWFEFVNIPNLFSPYHYELLRNDSYTKSWYGILEDWKNGVITIE